MNNHKLQLLRNGIRSALNLHTHDTDNIHACSAVFSKTLGRDTVREARDARFEQMTEQQKLTFHKNFPLSFNTNNIKGPDAELCFERVYHGRSVAMALSVIAMKEGMEAEGLRADYPDVVRSFKDASAINELRARFPELKTKHINRVIRTLAFEELRATLPDVSEKKLMKAARKLEI